MNPKMPRTPFSTALSGSAKETEIRLKNIFSGPKKRPPILVMALTALMILLCGNLVAFRAADATPLPGSSASVSVLPDTSASRSMLPDLSLPRLGTPVELHSLIAPSVSNFPYEYLTEAETARLQNLPAAELPKEAVPLTNAMREDFWEDLLLPVACDAASDVTVYFVFGGMPARTYYGVILTLWGQNLRQDGIVLRWGDRTEYFPLTWYTNAKYASNPPLLVDDLDGDGQPEAALSLAWSDGTGCYCECLYLFDLDTMTCTVPDYSDIPLDVTLSPNGSNAFLSSGGQEWTVDLSRLGVPFPGRVDVGKQIQFTLQNGKILCHLDLDFSCDTLGYLATAAFPVVYENGAYRLGPAERLGDLL